MASDAEGNGLRRSVYLGALSACILLAVSACSGSASVATSGQPKSATQTTSVTDPQHATGVSSHLVMPSDTLVSGANEQGVLVIENNSGRPVVAAQSCLSTIEVQLTNAQHPLALIPPRSAVLTRRCRSASQDCRLPCTPPRRCA